MNKNNTKKFKALLRSKLAIRITILGDHKRTIKFWGGTGCSEWILWRYWPSFVARYPFKISILKIIKGGSKFGRVKKIFCGIRRKKVHQLLVRRYDVVVDYDHDNDRVPFPNFERFQRHPIFSFRVQHLLSNCSQTLPAHTRLNRGPDGPELNPHIICRYENER